jgi:hypothetical protein
MINNLFYIFLSLIVTFIVCYYLSGIYFYISKRLKIRRNIRYFEEEIKKMETSYDNKEIFHKLDAGKQTALKENIKRYKEALLYIRQNGLD